METRTLEQKALTTRLMAAADTAPSNDVIRTIQTLIDDRLYVHALAALDHLETGEHSIKRAACDWAASHDWYFNHAQDHHAPSCGIWDGGRWIIYVRDNGSILAFASIKALKLWAGY